MQKHKVLQKQRLLSKTVDRVYTFLKPGNPALSSLKVVALLKRLRRLLRQLSAVPQTSSLKKVLASGTVAMLMLSSRLDGQITFANPVIQPFNIDTLPPPKYAAIPTTVDLDGDGDLDLFVATDYDSVFYYQNVGTPTQPNFSAGTPKPFGIRGTGRYLSCPDFADMDNDGDLDLMMFGDYVQGNFLYQENTGTATAPAFGPQQVNPFGLQALGSDRFSFGELVDLDADGDMDIVIWAYSPSHFIYYENTGSVSAPSFGTGQIGAFGMDTVSTTPYLSRPSFADLDMDGDLDLLVGAYEYFPSTQISDGAFFYRENIGSASNPAFGPAQRNPFGLSSVYYFNPSTFTDLDGDGDMDVLTGEYGGDLYYFENTTPVANDPGYPGGRLELYPNPTQGSISLRSYREQIQAVQVLNLQGQLVLSPAIGAPQLSDQYTQEGHFLTLEIGALPPGMYLVRIETNKQVVNKKVRKY